MNNSKIVITGAAGLVGQNLLLELKKLGYTNIVAIDKHKSNIKILESFHPEIKTICVDIINEGSWLRELDGCDILITLHAQIGAKKHGPFVDNNVKATSVIVDYAKNAGAKYIIHVSSSVVESIANDLYTETKKIQEQIIINSRLDYCILRPTLMFGWFDRKHLGWLSRFMKKVPIFPIPGSGRFMRQPLYVRDFCKIIISCMSSKPKNKVYNITGREKIDYIDLIKRIKFSLNSKVFVVRIPYWLFWSILKIYSVFDRDPPFTVEQLKALTAGDEFELINWWDIFSVTPTPLDIALKETFTDPQYSKVSLDF